MHGVAAEVAQEVVVFLQNHGLDTGAGKQESVNESGGTAAGNTDLGLHRSHELSLPADVRGLTRHYCTTSLKRRSARITPVLGGNIPAAASGKSVRTPKPVCYALTAVISAIASITSSG